MSSLLKSTKQLLLFTFLCLLATTPLSLRAAVEIGDEMKDHDLLTILDDDSTETQSIFKLQDEEKHHFIVVEFFATWCGPCMSNFDNVVKLSKDIKDVASMRLISLDYKYSELKKMVDNKRKEITFPVSFDEKRVVSKEYGVKAIPTLMILDQDHKLIYKHVGGLKDKDFDEIKKLLGIEPK